MVLVYFALQHCAIPLKFVYIPQPISRKEFQKKTNRLALFTDENISTAKCAPLVFPQKIGQVHLKSLRHFLTL